MSTIIDLMDYRKRKCMEALMLQIGLPGYCDECGEGIEELLLAEAAFADEGDEIPPFLLPEEPPARPPHPPARIIPFVTREQRAAAAAEAAESHPKGRTRKK